MACNSSASAERIRTSVFLRHKSQEEILVSQILKPACGSFVAYIEGWI